MTDEERAKLIAEMLRLEHERDKARQQRFGMDDEMRRRILEGLTRGFEESIFNAFRNPEQAWHDFDNKRKYSNYSAGFDWSHNKDHTGFAYSSDGGKTWNDLKDAPPSKDHHDGLTIDIKASKPKDKPKLLGDGKEDV